VRQHTVGQLEAVVAVDSEWRVRLLVAVDYALHASDLDVTRRQSVALAEHAQRGRGADAGMRAEEDAHEVVGSRLHLQLGLRVLVA
jgi:hypothetical protein